MAVANMTTTKIDRDSLSKLRMLAEREKRSQSSQLAVLIDNAFRTNPAELSDQTLFANMMDSITSDIEQGIPSDISIQNAAAFSAANRISWGEENGRIVGVMADGTRCNVDGFLIDK